MSRLNDPSIIVSVATVLTVYGIETIISATKEAVGLQQCLPFTVLKPLPFIHFGFTYIIKRCNSAYRLRY